MLITRVSSLTGMTHTRDIAVTQSQLDRYYLDGMLLQLAFPFLPPADREFIKTGITTDEWDDFLVEQQEEMKHPGGYAPAGD